MLQSCAGEGELVSATYVGGFALRQFTFTHCAVFYQQFLSALCKKKCPHLADV